MPTLRDIAAATGLGQATVSRALAEHPAVAVATRERVRRMAWRLGWRPDPALQALARYRWPGGRSAPPLTIIHLVDRYTAANREKVAAVRERASALGYRLQQRLDWRPGLRAAGVLVDCHLPCDPPLPWDELAVVNVGEGGLSGPCHRVGTDWRHGIDLIREGIPPGTRVGCVAFRYEGEGLRRAVLAEFLLLRAELQVEDIPILEITSPRSAAFLAWLRTHKPEAVVAAHGCVADWLRHSGWPATLHLIGLGGGDGLDLRLANRLVHALELLHSRILTGERGRPAQPLHLLVQGIRTSRGPSGDAAGGLPCRSNGYGSRR